MRRRPSRWRGEGGLPSSRARPVTGKIFHRRRGLRYYYCGSGRTGAIAGVYSLLGTSANGIREWGRPGSSPENLGLVMGPTGRHNYESASKDRRGYITLKQALCDRAFRSDARGGGSCGWRWCLTGHLGEPPTPRSAPLRFSTGRRTSLLHVPAEGMVVERSEQRRTSILIKKSHFLPGPRDLRSMVAFCKQRLAIFGSIPQPRDPRRGRSTRYACSLKSRF